MRKHILTNFIALSMVAALIAPAFVFAQESPVIANLRVSEITDISAVIEWSTNLATQGTVEYGLTASYTSKVGFQGESRTSHRLTLSNLKSETIYHFRAISSTASTEVYSFDQTFKTTKAIDRDTPVVTDVAIPYQGPTSAVIQWRTNEPADSLVLFGFTTSYGNQRGEGERVTVHDLMITGLQPLTTYHFQVKSKDEGNNVGVSSNYSFRTTSGPASNPPLDVTSVRPVSINDIGVTDTSADISWRTSNLAEGIVRWGPTDGLGREVRTVRPRNFVHAVRLVDLQPATTYFYQIEARDMFGSTFRTGIYSFTTTGGYVAPPPSTGRVLGVSSGRDLIFYSSFDRGLNADFALGDPTAGHFGAPHITSGRQGIRGEAADFTDGSHVSYSGVGNFEMNEGTIAFWYKSPWHPNDDRGHRFFKLDGGEPIAEPYFAISKVLKFQTPPVTDLDNSLAFAVADANVSIIHKLIPGSYLQQSQWQFVTVTWSFNSGLTQLYLNGSAANVQPLYNLQFRQQALLGSMPLSLGRRFTLGDPKYPMNALMDELAIFGRPLNPDEVKLLYIEGISRFLSKAGTRPLPGLVSTPPVGRVLGASTLQYTPASALLKAEGEPDVYAILNGQKHKISGPSSFAAYGYRWSDVRTVKPAILEKIPYARLVRTPDDPHIYFLYQRPQRQWLKLQIPSPTVFISYPGNFWGNVVTINEIDAASYPPVRLISANGSTYLLENNRKRLIENDATFDMLQLPRSHVAAVNQTHLDFYPLGEPIR